MRLSILVELRVDFPTKVSAGQLLPEHIQSHLEEIRRTADAADATEAAIKANITELAVELKTKREDLLENALEEAKTRGLIGSGGNVPVP
ncbi:hypothetical protein TrVFT333_005919 [Trichoderma virens FT-333]|nr:hypothetical protein TrVFT333_005919 [Trichoderma virens FT-333]